MNPQFKKNPSKTMLTICVGLILLYFLTEWKPYLFISFAIGFIGVLSDFLSSKIEYVWMKIAWLLSLVVPNVILSILFYLVLFPISVLAKFFGKKDPLLLKKQNGTMYILTNKDYGENTFKNPW